MSAIKLSTPSSGSISLSPADTASNLTITVPASTSTILTSTSPSSDLPSSINGPAFSATLTTNQTTTSGVFTKLTINNEVFDTASCFDSVTNYRFTPNVAGYYQVNLRSIGSNATTVAVWLYKNGSSHAIGLILQPSVSNGTSSSMTSSLIYMNGSTDYVEAYGLGIGANATFVAGIPSTEFSAFLARAA